MRTCYSCVSDEAGTLAPSRYGDFLRERTMARLILLLKTSAPKLIDLAAERTVIGREVDNDVQIDRPRISRHHAELRVKGEATWVHDLNSSNGTFVNGRQVQKHKLRHGDVIRIGDCDIRFLSRASALDASGELSLAD